MKGHIMNIYLKVLAAGAVALALSQTASAQVRVGIYAGAPAYYGPQPVRVQQQYIPAPVYYQEYGYRHDWRARREAQLRREEWLRREDWRREHWRREQWRQHRHHDRGWDDR
jgi:hypothetical protein